jgi:hypothetical protein
MNKKFLVLTLCVVIVVCLCACGDAEAIGDSISQEFPMNGATVVEKVETISGNYHLTFENYQYKVKVEMNSEAACQFEVNDVVDCVIELNLGSYIVDCYSFGFEIKEPSIRCVGFSVVGLEP